MSERPTEAGPEGTTRTGALVSFRIRDAYHPPEAELLHELFGDRIVQGRVAAYTDNGEPGGRFVVVRVASLSELVIVPLCSVIESGRPDPSGAR